MASRFRVPRQRTPQPDRDFSFGMRPQDTLNKRLPWQQGIKGGIAGLGQANSFKPKQGQMKRRIPRPQQPLEQTQAAKNPGVRMSFAGDPTQIAQTFQSLVNGTGFSSLSSGAAPTSPTQPTAASNPFLLGPGGQYQSPGGLQGQIPGPGQALSETPAPGQVPGTQPPGPQVPGPQTPGLEPNLPPAISSPESEFSSLQDYLGAVGRIDLIDENAYRTFSGWTPQIPEYAQQKIALDNQLQMQLVQATGSQETAKAMQKLVLSRLIEDELEDQASNREVSAARGLGSSSIKADNERNINKGYMREAGTGYLGLVNQLMGQGQSLAGGYGDYLASILGLSSDEASELFERGLGGGGGTPAVESPKGKGKNKDKDKGGGQNKNKPKPANKPKAGKKNNKKQTNKKKKKRKPQSSLDVLRGKVGR